MTLTQLTALAAAHAGSAGTLTMAAGDVRRLVKAAGKPKLSSAAADLPTTPRGAVVVPAPLLCELVAAASGPTTDHGPPPQQKTNHKPADAGPVVDYASMTVKELRDLAAELDIPLPLPRKKQDLIDAIEAAAPE